MIDDVKKIREQLEYCYSEGKYSTDQSYRWSKETIIDYALKQICDLDKPLDRPELRGKSVEQWTTEVNAIVGVLKVEMDGGFLENTAKYKDYSEDIIYSCLRAVASQILALIPVEPKPDNFILDEEGINCSACGKDIYHCQCNKPDVSRLVTIDEEYVLRSKWKRLNPDTRIPWRDYWLEAQRDLTAFIKDARYRQAVKDSRDGKPLDLAEGEFELFCSIENMYIEKISKVKDAEIAHWREKCWNDTMSAKKSGYDDGKAECQKRVDEILSDLDSRSPRYRGKKDKYSNGWNDCRQSFFNLIDAIRQALKKGEIDG